MPGLDTPLTPLRFLERAAEVHLGEVAVIDRLVQLTPEDAVDKKIERLTVRQVDGQA